jgi:serine phosphatase RsbU (regulator of sigma subunit)
MAQPNRRDTGTGRSHVSDRARAVSSAAHGGRGGTATRQSPPPQRAQPSPGRKHASDRQREVSATRANLAPIKGRLGTKPRGMGLRAKFMLTLALATAVALGALGLSMWLISSKYLFSQKQHDGIEVAMATAQIATAVADQLKIYDNAHQEQSGNDVLATARKQIAANVGAYVANAARWDSTASATGGGNGEQGATDILAVLIESAKIPELQGQTYGPVENGTTPGSQYSVLFLPKNGSSLQLPQGIQVYEGVKQTDSGAVPVYRFKLALDPVRFGDNASVRVDVDARGVDNVKFNLMATIFTAVGIAIVAVIIVANWLATNITSPVLILLKDMQAVARGDLEHNTKAHSTDEIGILAHEFNRMTMNLKEAQSALVEQEKAEYELSIAREVQKQLLPAEPPLITGFECADYYKGAKAVSGDYYDFIPLGNGLWGFIVADVSGKGIPGSMVMAVTRTIVRLIAVRHQNRAADTLKDTNRLIAKQIKRGMFVTSFYAVLDERSGQLTYASAGHNPMIIYRAASRSVELASGKGIALGFNEGPIFDKTIEEHRTVLGARDAILLYTDGFPEAMNADNQEFGEERFNQLVANFGHLDARTLIERLVAAVASHRGEAEQSDDLTLITVRRA